MTEEELIKGCIKGAAKSQKELYEKYAPVFLGICFRYYPHYDVANDILQDSFVKIFNSIKTYQGSGSFEGWMKRICVNTALSELRKSKNVFSIENWDGMEELQVEESSDERDIVKLICMMPDGYREVFNLHGVEGYSFKEIGGMLGQSEGNVRVKYHRARKKMQELLKQYFIEVP